MTLWRKLVAGLAATVLAGPALGLSCLPPDAARSFQQLDEAEETYVVVHGTLTFDASRLPEVTFSNQANPPTNTTIPAHLTGKSLSREGFQTPFDRDITLDVQCLGPWCGSAESGTQVLGFVERRQSGYVLTLDPCFSYSVIDPTDQMLEQVKSCMRGGPCEPRPY